MQITASEEEIDKKEFQFFLVKFNLPKFMNSVI